MQYSLASLLLALFSPVLSFLTHMKPSVQGDTITSVYSMHNTLPSQAYLLGPASIPGVQIYTQPSATVHLPTGQSMDGMTVLTADYLYTADKNIKNHTLIVQGKDKRVHYIRENTMVNIVVPADRSVCPHPVYSVGPVYTHGPAGIVMICVRLDALEVQVYAVQADGSVHPLTTQSSLPVQLPSIDQRIIDLIDSGVLMVCAESRQSGPMVIVYICPKNVTDSSVRDKITPGKTGYTSPWLVVLNLTRFGKPPSQDVYIGGEVIQPFALLRTTPSVQPLLSGIELESLLTVTGQTTVIFSWSDKLFRLSILMAANIKHNSNNKIMLIACTWLDTPKDYSCNASVPIDSEGIVAIDVHGYSEMTLSVQSLAGGRELVHEEFKYTMNRSLARPYLTIAHSGRLTYSLQAYKDYPMTRLAEGTLSIGDLTLGKLSARGFTKDSIFAFHYSRDSPVIYSQMYYAVYASMLYCVHKNGDKIDVVDMALSMLTVHADTREHPGRLVLEFKNCSAGSGAAGFELEVYPAVVANVSGLALAIGNEVPSSPDVVYTIQQTVVASLSTPLDFTNALIKGGWTYPPAVTSSQTTQVSSHSLTRIRVLERDPSTGILGESKRNRLLSTRDYSIDLDNTQVLHCESDLGREIISVCTPIEGGEKGVKVDRLLRGSLALEGTVLLLHVSGGEYMVSAVNVNTGDRWTEKIDDMDKQREKTFAASYIRDESGIESMMIGHGVSNNGTDGYRIHVRYRNKPDKTLVRNYTGRVIDAVGVVSGYLQIMGLYQDKVQRFGLTQSYNDVFTNSKIITPGHEKNYKAVCAVSAFVYAVTDGKTLDIMEEDDSIITLATFDNQPLGEISKGHYFYCDSHYNILWKRSDRSIIEYDTKLGRFAIEDARFNPRKIFSTKSLDFDEEFAFRTTDGWFLFRDQSTEGSGDIKSTSTYELNADGMGYLVKSQPSSEPISTVSLSFVPMEGVVSPVKSIKLDYQLNAIKVIETIDVTAIRDAEDPEVSGPICNRTLPTGHTSLERCTDIDGHILSVGTAVDSTRVQFKGKLYPLPPIDVGKDTEIIDFDNDYGHTAVMWRNKKAQTTVNLTLYKEGNALGTVTLSTGVLLPHNMKKLRIHRSENPNMMIASVVKLDTNHTAAQIMIVSFSSYSPNSTSISVSGGKVLYIGEDIIPFGTTVPGVVVYDKRHMQLRVTLPTSDAYGEKEIITIQGVHYYSVLEMLGKLVILHCNHGQGKLHITIIDQKEWAIRNLTIRAEGDGAWPGNRIGYFESMNCEISMANKTTGNVSLECTFGGRRVMLVMINIPDLKSSMEAVIIDTAHSSSHIVVVGSRYSETVAEDTFDCSGVSIYNRLGTPTGSRFVRAFLSKDDIFSKLKSNLYRVTIQGNILSVHGGRHSFIERYEIGEYAVKTDNPHEQPFRMEVLGARGNKTVSLAWFFNLPKPVIPEDENKKREEPPSQWKNPIVLAVLVTLLIVLSVLGYLWYQRSIQSNGSKRGYSSVRGGVTYEMDSIDRTAHSMIDSAEDKETGELKTDKIKAY